MKRLSFNEISELETSENGFGNKAPKPKKKKNSKSKRQFRDE